MTWIQALILGAVQGASEFLPISSSAHLVLVPWALGWELEPHSYFLFIIAIHWGTLAALILITWRELVHIARAAARSMARREWPASPDTRLAAILVVATLPAALAGVLLGEAVEQAFSDPTAVGRQLLGTAALLVLAEQVRDRRAAGSTGFRSFESVRLVDGLWIGLAQAVALLPGISRSGATLSAGMIRGLDRVQAVRFSFLLSVPILFGAGLVALADLAGGPGVAEFLPELGIGFLASGVVGFASIRWLLRYLSRASLRGFGLYCAGLGLTVLLVSAVRG
jgi:undecaprenyl-diphosphatase